MNEYITNWENYLRENGKSENTITAYSRNVQAFIDWLQSITSEEFNGKITIMDGNSYMRYLTDKKLTLNSIKAKMTALQKFSQWLTGTGHMPSVKIAQKKGTITPDVEVLEKNQLYKYMRYILNSGNKLNIAIVTLILNTGIRESELCALSVDDIDMTDRKGTMTIRNGKGDKYRTIPLNKDARDALSDWLSVRPSDKGDTLFIGQRGAFNRNAIYKITSKLGEKSIGIAVYPHMLRHQCFTAMAKNPDIDIKTISEIAGHSTIEITSKYYIHSSRQEQENAVDALKLF